MSRNAARAFREYVTTLIVSIANASTGTFPIFFYRVLVTVIGHHFLADRNYRIDFTAANARSTSSSLFMIPAENLAQGVP